MALAVLVILTASCSASSTTPTLQRLRWHEVKALPSAFEHYAPVGLAGSTRGFVVAIARRDSSIGPSLFASTNGQSWVSTAPRGYMSLADDQPLASHGREIYLLGSEDTNGQRAAVWTSSDTRHWAGPFALPGSVGGSLVGVAAGPRGIIAVALNGNDSYFTSNLLPMPTGYQIWFSRDGRSYSPPITLLVKHPPASQFVSLLATPAGFDMLAGGLLIKSADGRNWRVDAPVGVTLDAAMGLLSYRINETIVIAQNRLGGWYQETSTPRRQAGDFSSYGLSAVCPDNNCSVSYPPLVPRWNRMTHFDFGRLPDIGVTKSQAIYAVTPVRNGFVAAGWAAYPYVGAVWTSQDGRRWTKAATKKNSFEDAQQFSYAASSNSRVLLIGIGVPTMTVQPSGTKIWIGF